MSNTDCLEYFVSTLGLRIVVLYTNAAVVTASELTISHYFLNICIYLL